jgi:hypothetical protein
MHLLTKKRLRRYSAGLLVGMAIAFVVSVFSAQGARTLAGRLGGDFPAFYGAARIVASGNAAALYVLEQQRASQQDILPERAGFLPYAYPPFVALAYAPLAALPYRVAYVLHTAFMVAAVVLSLWLLRPVSQTIDEHFLPAVALAMAFSPLMKATLNGQNTPITLLLILLAWTAARSGRSALAGVWLGLLLYKPQFGVPLIGVQILARRWTTVVASTGVGVGLYAVSALVMGRDWSTEWLEFANWLSTIDATLDRQNAISWLGFLQALLGAESRGALAVGGALIVATVLGISWLWARRLDDEAAVMAVTAPCLILMAPHAMYYESGLCLITYAIVLDRSSRHRSLIAGGVLLLGASQVLANGLGVSPVFLLTVGTLGLALATLHGTLTSPRKADARA